MFDLVINIFIIFFLILFINVIIQNQQHGETLEDIWNKYQDDIMVIRTYVKIVGVILICWLSTIDVYMGVFGAILYIVVMEYDHNNELHRINEDNHVNKLHKGDNKIDYFVAENSVKPRPGFGADKSLFSSTSAIDPYDTDMPYNTI